MARQDSPVRVANATATGTLVATRARVYRLFVAPGASAGSIVLRDNGAGGTVLGTWQTVGGGSNVEIDLGPAGLRFATDVHVTLSNVAGITAVHQ